MNHFGTVKVIFDGAVNGNDVCTGMPAARNSGGDEFISVEIFFQIKLACQTGRVMGILVRFGGSDRFIR